MLSQKLNVNPPFTTVDRLAVLTTQYKHFISFIETPSSSRGGLLKKTIGVPPMWPRPPLNVISDRTS